MVACMELQEFVLLTFIYILISLCYQLMHIAFTLLDNKRDVDLSNTKAVIKAPADK